MKRIWFFLIALSVIFSSLESRGTVVSQDRAMVHAVGIDRSSGGIEVTLQVFRPEGSGSETQLDAAKSNVFTISDTGATLEEALRKCEGRLGEFLFVGHEQVIVLGSGTEPGDPEKLLSYFIRGRECYLGVQVIAAEGKASKLLQAELSEGAVAAENLVGIIERHAKDSSTVTCDLLTFLDDSGLGCAVVPSAKLEKAPEEESSSGEKGSSAQGDTVSAAGAVVYKNGKRAFELDASQCAALSCLRGGRDSELLQLPGSNGLTAVFVRHEGAALTLRQDSGRLRVRCSITLSLPPDSRAESDHSKQELCSLVTAAVQKECESLFSLAYTENSADVLGISRLVRQRLPSLWQQTGSSAETIAQLCDMTFDISCRAG